VIVLGTDGAGRDGGRVDRRGRWLVRVATAGLAVVLLGLTGAAVLTAASVDDAVQRLQRISGERDAWVEVRYQVAQERSIGHAYLARPNPKLRPALEKARTALGVALGHLVVNGEPEDVAEARRVQARHAPNLVLMGQMLDLVDAGDTDAANDLHADRVHPAYIDLQNETALLADREQAEATASMTLLRHRQHALLPAALVAGLVGMLALGGFLLLALGYQRQLVRQAAASHHQALHDPLTGLPNRELFADRVGQALRAADRELRPAALLLLDLDRFKDVNDTLGHHHGDRLLTLDGVALDLDASIGIAVYPDHGGDAAELLQHADVAMYAAKQAHAGFMVYDPTVDQHSPRRLALLGGLRRALERDELTLHYQPKAHLESGEVLGVEALARWQHPDHGLLGPGEFIPLAERTGLIHPLTRWVLDAALRQAAEWHRAGHHLSVAVNVSTRSLLDASFPEQVAGRLAHWEVPAGWLVLEVTESAVMADPALALDVLGRLHALGVGLAVDDFGTGYSSMSYLKALPVDELKVDRSFVGQMVTSNSDAVIVRSTIDLGHNLGLRVVAEGVENQGRLGGAEGARLRHRPGLLPRPADAGRRPGGVAPGGGRDGSLPQQRRP
jgi:diguanylate cyclase